MEIEKVVKTLRRDLLIDIFDDSGEKKSPGGIIILEGEKVGKEHKGTTGIVKCIGHELGPSDKLGLEPGSKVLFDVYAGTIIKIDSKEYLVINYDEILAVLL